MAFVAFEQYFPKAQGVIDDGLAPTLVMSNSASTKNSVPCGNSLGLLSSDTIWPSVPALTLTKHVSRVIRVRRRRAFGRYYGYESDDRSTS
jgi:hypothetical protein